MSNSQTNLQIIANYATFLVNNRRKPSSENQKGTCPNGQVPFIISESLITPRRLPARRLMNTDYQQLIGSVKSTGTLNPTHSARFYTLMSTIDMQNYTLSSFL